MKTKRQGSGSNASISCETIQEIDANPRNIRTFLRISLRVMSQQRYILLKHNCQTSTQEPACRQCVYYIKLTQDFKTNELKSNLPHYISVNFSSSSAKLIGLTFRSCQNGFRVETAGFQFSTYALYLLHQKFKSPAFGFFTSKLQGFQS